MVMTVMVTRPTSNRLPFLCSKGHKLGIVARLARCRHRATGPGLGVLKGWWLRDLKLTQMGGSLGLNVEGLSPIFCSSQRFSQNKNWRELESIFI